MQSLRLPWLSAAQWHHPRQGLSLLCPGLSTCEEGLGELHLRLPSQDAGGLIRHYACSLASQGGVPNSPQELRPRQASSRGFRIKPREAVLWPMWHVTLGGSGSLPGAPVPYGDHQDRVLTTAHRAVIARSSGRRCFENHGPRPQNPGALGGGAGSVAKQSPGGFRTDGLRGGWWEGRWILVFQGH